MKKNSIILIAVLISIIAGFYFLTAIKARKKSDELLSQFKEVERSLDNSLVTVPNAKGIGAVEKLYPIALMKTQIILLIDSLKESSEKIFEPSKPNEIPKQFKADLKRLLSDIQQLNKLKWDLVDSSVPDTIRYWLRSDQFREKKWLSTFEGAPKEEIITCLNYLRNETMSIH